MSDLVKIWSFEHDAWWRAASCGYTTERGERDDYDFRVEFTETVSETEERAVISLLEAAPKLRAACDLVQRAHVGDGVTMAEAVDACLLAVAHSNQKEA